MRTIKWIARQKCFLPLSCRTLRSLNNKKYVFAITNNYSFIKLTLPLCTCLAFISVLRWLNRECSNSYLALTSGTNHRRSIKGRWIAEDPRATRRSAVTYKSNSSRFAVSQIRMFERSDATIKQPLCRFFKTLQNKTRIKRNGDMKRRSKYG